MNKYLTKKIKSAFLATTILAESMLSTVSLADPPGKRSTDSDQATTQSMITICCPNLSPNSDLANPECTRAILSGHLPTAETKSSSAEVPTSKEITVESSKKQTAAIIQKKATPSSAIPSVYSVDEQALIAKLNHIRHTLKKEAFVDFCENIHKEMNQHRSSNFNKWCLSTLIKILEIQPNSTQIKDKICRFTIDVLHSGIFYYE